MSAFDMSDEVAEETIDVIYAAIDNLRIDIDSGDESAMLVLRSFTGKTRLSKAKALELIEEVDSRFNEFAKDVLG